MLRKKMIRDIRQNLSQFITIFLMVFLGVMAYSGIRSYMNGMQDTANSFYEECNLYDLNIAGNISNKDLKKIRNMDHVKGAERLLTVVGDVVGSDDKSLQMNFLESNTISKFYVSDGKDFDKNTDGFWIDEYYAKANDLKVGDTISIKYDNYTFKKKIVGIIMTPDHVYDIKDESAIFPNHETYGYVYASIKYFPSDYIKSEVMDAYKIDDEALFDLMVPDFDYKDYLAYTSCIVDVDSKKNVNAVKNEIDEKIDDAKALIKVEDSTSYTSVQDEIEEGETYVGVFSGLFLFIALLSVITTMTRVVSKQRIQIGTLKALGFKKRKITMHYISYGFWIALVGAVLGLIAGPLLIGNIFVNMEFSMYQAPNVRAGLSNKSYFVAAGVVLAVAFITYLTCRKQLKESPANTLRTKMPDVNSHSLSITNNAFFKKLGFINTWNIRDMFRNKMRSIMGIAGIAGCCLLLVTGFGMLDSLNSYLDWQFDTLYDFKYKVSLSDDCTTSQLEKIEDAYGNATSQTLYVEVKEGDNWESNNIYVDDSDGYVQITDTNRNVISLDDDSGVYVTEKLASVKGYELGDTIEWRVYGEDTVYSSKIVGFDRDPQNQNIKMTKAYLKSLDRKYEPDSIYTNQDLKDEKIMKGVELIQDKDALREGMSSMLSMMSSMIVILVALAGLLGAVIIYNLGILSFTEKQYQFATLKVLGFKDKQIKKIYTRQNTWLTIFAIIIGCPAGFYTTDYIFKAALADSYDFNAVINITSYLIAIVGTFVVSFVVSKFLALKVKKIDMVSSLKGNE